MQKMKRELYKKIIADPYMSTNKLHVLMYLISIQRADGRITGVHHKDIAAAVGCSRSEVYYALGCLASSGYIEKSKAHPCDMDILIPDNMFSPDIGFLAPDYGHSSYINLNIRLLDDAAFWKLPIGALKVALYWLNRIGGQQGNRKLKDRSRLWSSSFMEDIKKLLCVQARTARKYIRMLAVWLTSGLTGGTGRTTS